METLTRAAGATAEAVSPLFEDEDKSRLLDTRGWDLMPRRAGSADLPLHGGRVPHWLGERMTRLGAVISEAIVHRLWPR